MEKKPHNNRYLVFINLGAQMGIMIAGGVFLGIWLDKKIPNKYSAFTIGLSLFGVFLALYQVFRSVKDLGGKND
ncbi:AtpZ/AtpI family protein [Zunongwangia sp.]|uniref:AtpZ/AtpI family protein n=1 Tax=Zunongwangia sp. TaxID=1965325 RepID=UPI003AA9268C